MHRSAAEGHRVLVSAPYGRDAGSVAKLLADNGYETRVCDTLTQVADQLDDQTGVVLVTEEALRADLGPLHRVLEVQPAWSDIPFVLLAGRHAESRATTEAIRRRLPDSAINVILLERPLSSESLLSAIASAMRARQKQFEIRDQLTELQAQHSRMAALLDNLPVGIAFVNRDGSTLMSNPAFRAFQPTGEVPSMQSDGEVRWQARDEAGNPLPRNRFPAARALQGETVAGIEFLYRPGDGADVWTRVTGVPLFEGDRVSGAISVVVDINEQKRAQETLAQAAQKLEEQVSQRTSALRETLARLKAETEERARAEAALHQAQKMEAVGQLTGGIAHDFNNMLTGVIGAIDILKRRIAAGRLDDLDRFMDAASTSAQRAAALTARLLAFSRRQSLDSRPTDINALVGSLEELLNSTLSETIEVAIVTTNDSLTAVVDANQLENAILNLAINARDAMPEGGRLTVETGIAELDAAYCATRPGIMPGRYVVVAVSDTGAGMSEELLEKVFDPFFTTKPIGQGTGLGLSMVYGFAKQSNGQVRIHSAPGQGTSVKIFLPAADQKPEVREIHAGPLAHGDGQTVLLVEDDESVRLLVRDVLQELGYDAIEAAEPETAIRLLASGRSFDLMISDVGLPGMNGRQLADSARKHLPDLPILFITGYAENATIRSGFLGANMDMITKPFQIETLSAKISDMLSQA